MIQSDLCHETLKAVAALSCRTRLAQIIINDQDASFRPPQRHGAPYEAILQLCRLLMIEYLLRCRLPNVNNREALHMSGQDFVAISLPRLSYEVQAHG
jgi:hypothetical protein